VKAAASRGSASAGAVWIALVKAMATAIALAAGFRAVSDDDFARVAIAEAWAHAPRLDPSGTSWLPLPFWLDGAVLAIGGRSLDVARLWAISLGILSALVVYLAARRLASDERSALAGAAIAAIFPWSARLGAATVPELPAAALSLFAMASLVPGGERSSGRARIAGGLALLAATLSRYEVWPIAVGFALLSLLDLRRASVADRPRIGAAAALSLIGPIAWMAWNRHAHGDALHFVARVTAYRKALGGEEPGALARLVAYPIALVREEPELFSALAVAIGLLALGGLPALRARLGRFARPAALVAAQIAALSLAMVKDGAPTHHPERAVLLAMLLAALVLGDLAAALFTAPLRVRVIAGALGISAIAGGVLVRRAFPGEGFTPRLSEAAIGRAARERMEPGDRALIEVADYGHLAIVAALGRPEDAVLDRSIDPRDPKVASSFDDQPALLARLAAVHVRYAIARPGPAASAVLGDPLIARGGWALYRAPRALPEESR
jgi:Dolichyl-phosphate-mannose-protein mannosyltransferase